MSLSVPAYQPPQFAAPIANAYAWIVQEGSRYDDGSGTLVFNVHPDVASANALKPPIDQVRIVLGQVLVPATPTTPAVMFPTMAQLDASAHALQQSTPSLTPMQALRLACYEAAVQHPLFAGATLVP